MNPKKIISKKQCSYCGKDYIPAYGGIVWKKAKFCSVKCARIIPWNKGKKLHYLVWNKGAKGKQEAWNKGKTKENNKSVASISETLKGKSQEWNKGKNHWNWRGGISKEGHLIRNTAEYRKWRMAVFQRDWFTCVFCGYRSRKKRDIRADHIKPFSLYPDLRFEISNGRTICIPCDLKYGWQLFRMNNPKSKTVTKNEEQPLL